MLLVIPKSSLSQDWTAIPHTVFGLGDSTIVDLGAYGGNDITLIIRFLQSEDLSKSRVFRSESDIAAFFIDKKDGSPALHIGEFRLWNSISNCHIEDFDRNGKLDVYIKAYTGGNGMLAALGGVYEVSVNEDDEWQVEEIMFFASEPEAFDIDEDGLWEFAVREECWAFASSHATAARFWAQFFKPDTLNGGYYLANKEMAPFFEVEIDKAKEEYKKALTAFTERPSRQTTNSCAFKSEIVLAWLIAAQDSVRINDWLDKFEPVFQLLKVEFEERRTILMYSEYHEVREAVRKDLQNYSAGILPKRWKP